MSHPDRLVALSLLLLTGCLSVENVGDTGDAGDSGPSNPTGTIDSGARNDAGSFIDSGQQEVDAGSDLPPSVALAISANPNSVLSAIANVSWTGSMSSVYVTWSNALGQSVQTPIANIEGVVSPKNLPVLGLRDSTLYNFQAVATDTDGGVYMSALAPLTTDAMPVGVPIYRVETFDGGTPAPGYTIVAALPNGAPAPDYEVIVDNTGYPVWYLAASPACGGDFQQQPDGTYTIALLDSTHPVAGIDDTITLYYQYDVLGNLLHVWQAFDVDSASPPIDALATDDHEIRIEPNGDALLFGFDEANNQDLTSMGGQGNASIIGDVMERVTVSDQVTFHWDSLSNLSIADFDTACDGINAAQVDYPHANAIDVTSDGNYLLSFRNASQVLKVNSTSAATMWTLGRHGQFTFINDPLGGFSCQHGARELTPANDPLCPAGGDCIILFDDGNGHSPSQSRAVEYALDTTAMTATLVWSQEATPMEYSFILGFAQRLGNGNTLVTYGKNSLIEEVDANSNLVWKLTPAQGVYGFYRAFRLDSLYGL